MNKVWWHLSLFDADHECDRSNGHSTFIALA